MASKYWPTLPGTDDEHSRPPQSCSKHFGANSARIPFNTLRRSLMSFSEC